MDALGTRLLLVRSGVRFRRIARRSTNRFLKDGEESVLDPLYRFCAADGRRPARYGRRRIETGNPASSPRPTLNGGPDQAPMLRIPGQRRAMRGADRGPQGSTASRRSWQPGTALLPTACLGRASSCAALTCARRVR
jgi:hypothetical protein